MTLLANQAADAVAIYDSNFNQVFINARPIKGAASEDSKLMEHPLETGAVIADHRIILPVEIQLSMILTPDEYRQTYQQIRQAFYAGTQYTVQLRAGGYQNMVIGSMPHDESADIFDTITLAIKLREVQFVTAQFVNAKSVNLKSSSVKNKKQQSTKSRGQQAAKTPSPALEKKGKSNLAKIADFVGGA